MIKWRTYLVLMILVAATVLLSVTVLTDRPDASIEQLATDAQLVALLSQPTFDHEELDRLMSEAGSRIAKNPNFGVQLCNFMRSGAGSERVKGRLRSLFLELRDPDSLRCLVEFAASQLDTLDLTLRPRSRREVEVIAVLNMLDDHPALESLRDNPSFEELLSWGARRQYKAVGEGQNRIKLMATAPVSPERRSQLLCDAILSGGSHLGVDRDFFTQLLEPERQRLRDGVSAWNGEPRSSPRPSMVALIWAKDAPGVELIARIARSDLVQDPRIRKNYSYLAELGQASQSADSALKYINSDIHDASTCNEFDAGWLIECAHQLGASKQQIRAALDTYKARVIQSVSRKASRVKAREPMIGYRLRPVYDAGVRIGVLAENEWPEALIDPYKGLQRTP